MSDCKLCRALSNRVMATAAWPSPEPRTGDQVGSELRRAGERLRRTCRGVLVGDTE